MSFGKEAVTRAAKSKRRKVVVSGWCAYVMDYVIVDVSMSQLIAWIT